MIDEPNPYKLDLFALITQGGLNFPTQAFAFKYHLTGENLIFV